MPGRIHLYRRLNNVSPRLARSPQPIVVTGNLFNITCQVKHLGLASLPTVLIPPVVFTGLLVSLWVYKCIMLIVFQNKIIYMPFVPPFSKSEKIEDYARTCQPVQWQEHQIHSSDNTRLSLAIGSIKTDQNSKANHAGNKKVIIVYFQG